MKKSVLYGQSIRIGFKKTLLVMKISVLLLMIGVHVSARNFAQENVTLTFKGESFLQVIKSIEKQTSYRFFYSDDVVQANKLVSVSVKNVSVVDVLATICKEIDLVFSILPNNRIILNSPNGILDNLQNSNLYEKNITGVVVDEKGAPLEGVTVAIKNTNIKAITDVNGRFSIKAKNNGNVTLVFTSVGFVQLERNVSSSTVKIDVSLKELPNSLEDVVVVGYGTVKRKELTTSVARVNVEDLQKSPVMSFDQALAGRAAGVQVVSQDGQPGAPINIVIRGNNSLTQDNSPLYVIDGFPLENPDNNVINPSEIESIEILKDASATAIYGARAANGVILITTKKGKTGPPKIEFQALKSTQNVLKRIELMNPYEFVQYQYELNPVNTIATYLRNVANDPFLIDSVMNTYKRLKGADFQDAVFGRQAPFVSSNISMRGGTDKTKYSLAFNYANQEGVVIKSGYKRYQTKFILDQSISKKMKVGVNMALTYTNQYGVQPVGSGTSGLAGGTSYLMASVWGFRPVTFTGNIDSLLDLPNDVAIDPLNTSTVFNPLYSTKNEHHQNNQISLFANTYFDYQILPKLLFRATAGVNQLSARREDFYNSQTSKGRVVATNPNGVNGAYSVQSTTNITNENTLTYNNMFKKVHHINLLGGFTSQLNTVKINGGSATNVPNESLGMSGLSQGIPGLAVVSTSQNALVSFLARVQYDYLSKYFLTASYRTDGSSKFSNNNRWSYFPSFSVGWRFSKEKFMNSIKYIDDAKLRFGLGATGNNRVSDYVTFSSMASGYSPVNNVFSYITNLGSLGNKDLKWETTTQSNLGLDLDLLKGKINLTVDLYRKVTSDLLLNAPLPGSSGFTSGFKNIGKISNQGLEISINTNNYKTKNFSWTTSFNISFNRSKVLELAENQEYQFGFVSWNGNYNSTPLYIAKKGEQLGVMFGYISDGVYQYADFDKSPSGVYTLKQDVPTSFTTRSTLPTPGAIKLKDINGDGVITAADRTVMGNGNPLHTGGFINNFKYKGFDLSVFFQWSYGNDIYNANRLVFENGSPNSSVSSLNMYKSYVNRWSPTNQTNDMPRANPGNLPGNYYWSRCIEDGSYLRLKTLSLGYAISPKMIKKLKNAVTNLRIYVATQNLLTFTKYTGFDPEVNGRPTALTPGFDFSVYPRANTLTFGINANF